MATLVADRPRALPVPLAGAARVRAYPAGLAALLFGLVAFATTPFVLGAIHAARAHAVFLGAVGNYPQDALQYLAWLRSAHDGLIRNLYGGADQAVFLHPMWSPSGWLQALTGVGDAAVIGFWTVVGALTLFAGCVQLAARHLTASQPARRLAAVAVALAGGLTPIGWLLERHDPALYARAIGDVVPLGTLWEYAPLAITIGLMAVAVPRIERLVEGTERRRSAVAGTAALALLITWLHPWQGETVLLIAIGLLAWRRLDASAAVWRPALGRVAPALIAGALPAAYYLLLSRIDAGWAQSERASRASQLPLQVAIYVILPLLLVWLLAARRLAGDRTVRGLVLWPAATVLTVLITPSGQYRALDGLIVPVAIMAVKAWPAGRGRPVASLLAGAAAVALALAPTYRIFAPVLADPTRVDSGPFTALNQDDVRAVAFAGRFADGRPILTGDVLGVAAPALTDQPTWIGHVVWTPDASARTAQSTALLTGALVPAAVRGLVASSRTRAIVQPCAVHGPPLVALTGLGFRAQRFGCATVYVRTA